MNIFIRQNSLVQNFFKNLLFFLFATFPIAIILGNLLINLYIFLIGLAYLVFHADKKIFSNKTFLILIFLFISLLVNLKFTNNFDLSYPRVIKFFFVIFFILSFEYLINLNNDYDKKIYKFWFILVVIFIIDLLVELFLGQNLLGMKSYIPGRLAGVFNDELVGGYFLFGFALISFCFFKKNITGNFLILLFAYFVIIFVSLAIGERSNLIKLLFGLSILILIFNRKYLKYVLVSMLLILLTFVGYVKFNKYYDYRYLGEIKNISNQGLEEYLKKSPYGAHYNAAYKVFQKNKIFGVGIKNFRIEGSKGIYHNEEYLFAFNKSNTHPHQIHFEFLAETGLFGYISFLIFIFFSLFISLRYCIINKNFYQLSSILFVLATLIPYLPSGSFFSTFNSSVFWINYAIMMAYNKKLN